MSHLRTIDTSYDNNESTMPFGLHSKFIRFSKSSPITNSLCSENGKFFTADYDGHGASYLVSMSQYFSGTFINEISPEEVYIHMLLAELFMSPLHAV